MQVRTNHSRHISSTNKNQLQNIFWSESDYLNYFHCLATNRPTLMLLIVLISRSSSANLKRSLCWFLFFSFLFFSFLGLWPLEKHIFLLLCGLKRVSWAKICVFMWQTIEDQTMEAVFSIFMSTRFEFGGKLELWASAAELFVFLITLCSWIIARKKSGHPLS